MARVPRSSLPPDGYFHVYARALAAAGLLFLDDDDRRNFLQLLLHAVRLHAWTCHAFCLMGTHYHLVIETQRESLSSGVHRLNWPLRDAASTRGMADSGTCSPSDSRHG